MDTPYVREWLRGEQILCYRFHELTRAGMDDWFNDVSSVNRLWPNRKPLHTLIDLRMERLFVSAQVLLRARDAAALRPGLPGRTAILIASPTVAQWVSGLIRTTVPLGVRQRQLFSDEALALDWLLETPGR